MGGAWNPAINVTGTMAAGPSPAGVAIGGIGCIP